MYVSHNWIRNLDEIGSRLLTRVEEIDDINKQIEEMREKRRELYKEACKIVADNWSKNEIAQAKTIS